MRTCDTACRLHGCVFLAPQQFRAHLVAVLLTGFVHCQSVRIFENFTWIFSDPGNTQQRDVRNNRPALLKSGSSWPRNSMLLWMQRSKFRAVLSGWWMRLRLLLNPESARQWLPVDAAKYHRLNSQVFKYQLNFWRADTYIQWLIYFFQHGCIPKVGRLIHYWSLGLKSWGTIPLQSTW